AGWRPSAVLVPYPGSRLLDHHSNPPRSKDAGGPAVRSIRSSDRVRGRSDHDFIATIDFLDLQAHRFSMRGREVFTDEVIADRQFPVAALDQYRQLHCLGPSDILY